MSRKMLVVLTAVLLGCPKTGPGDETGSTGPGEAPSLAEASGLSCYLQGVEDGPNYQLVVTGGTVSGLKLEIDINGRPWRPTPRTTLRSAHPASRRSRPTRARWMVVRRR